MVGVSRQFRDIAERAPPSHCKLHEITSGSALSQSTCLRCLGLFLSSRLDDYRWHISPLFFCSSDSTRLETLIR